jgi:hypothetical protein
VSTGASAKVEVAGPRRFHRLFNDLIMGVSVVSAHLCQRFARQVTDLGRVPRDEARELLLGRSLLHGGSDGHRLTQRSALAPAERQFSAARVFMRVGWKTPVRHSRLRATMEPSLNCRHEFLDSHPSVDVLIQCGAHRDRFFSECDTDAPD